MIGFDHQFGKRGDRADVVAFSSEYAVDQFRQHQPQGRRLPHGIARGDSMNDLVGMVFHPRIQILPDDRRDQRIVAGVGQYVEQCRHRVDAVELARGDRDLQLHVGR